jgi:hypothetical protein
MPALFRCKVFFCAVLSVCAGCNQKQPPRSEEAALFRTDSQSYTLRPSEMGYEAWINVEFTNRNADTVYFMNCNGVTGVMFEKVVDSTWRTAWIPGMNACMSPPIVVPPASTHTFPTHAFVARRDRVQAGELSIDDAPGTYRIVWPHTVTSYQSSPPFGDSLPFARRVSNTFTLRAPTKTGIDLDR